MTTSTNRRCSTLGLLLAVLSLAILACSASPALAASGWWQVTSSARPAVLPSEGRAELALTVENLGDAAVSGAATPVRIADVLPPGLKALSITASQPYGNRTPPPFACVEATLVCTFERELPVFDAIEIRIEVQVLPGAHTGELNSASVSGGNVPSATLERPITVGAPGATTPFGVEDYETHFEENGGTPDDQAGSHPFQFTTTVTLNQSPDEHLDPLGSKPEVEPVAIPKDINTKLPPGFFGNPVPFATCTQGQFANRFAIGAEGDANGCPEQSAVGVASVTINIPGSLAMTTFTEPVFNLEPTAGEPAQFGFLVAQGNAPVILDTSIRSGEDYGITVNANNITQTSGLISARVTIWGVPGAPEHDNARGWGCLERVNHAESTLPCEAAHGEHPPAFLTVPTSCTGPLQSSVEADSWVNPGEFTTTTAPEALQSLDGCNRVSFTPTVEAAPPTTAGSSPSGFNFNILENDEGLTNPEGLAQSQLNRAEVTLPGGVTVNPSSGVGLGGCTTADYARETLSSEPGAGCPNDSKIGTVSIDTPLLTVPVQGNVYVAQPFENPFPEPSAGHPGGTLVALYVVAKNANKGVLIKLAGKVTPNPTTGQLTTVFEHNPQLPFDHFNFHFREGQQAPLVTPATCGTYATEANLSPWSDPLTPLAESSSFQITSGPNGGPCPSGGVLPFAPQITAGTIDNEAGSFSPLYVHLTRTDAEQEIAGFSTVLPEGLTGDLTGVPFCSEADIEAARHKTGAQEEANPSCPAASQIGHTLVGTGDGSVLAYVPGKIYFAGPFRGAPFSIVSVTSAVVGPFDLGTVVLRFGLNIDPYTAKVNVSPTSSEPIPTIIDGIVTHVRDIRVYIDRPDFTLNPTSCEPKQLSSTLTSSLGASASTASPFQTVNCGNLKFAPKFTATTSGKTSKADGAGLHVDLSYPAAPQGTYADIAKVKVELPKQLPSRLTTLQKACTAAQFEANPAGCPGPSAIGTAKAVVPNIPEALTGPVYFVSHGGEAFPSLEIVLQGYGVKVILVGSTFISKSGITSSTFKAIPDNPVTSFELTLPEGKYSALAANGNLCALTKTVTVKKKTTVKVHGKRKTVTRSVKTTTPETLKMPTEFTAQDGAITHQITQVDVTGCTKAVKSAKAKKKGKTGKKGRK